jgi:hypothetical protein
MRKPTTLASAKRTFFCVEVNAARLGFVKVDIQEQ